MSRHYRYRATSSAKRGSALGSYGSLAGTILGEIMRWPIRLTSPQLFWLVSFVLIMVMVVAASLVESRFYRNAIIERETSIVRDAANAIIAEQQVEHGLSASDIEHYEHPAAQSHFELSFSTLSDLFGVGRIKVFDREQRIVWSDQPSLIGTRLTAHPYYLTRALLGESSAVANPADRALNAAEGLPQVPLIEFYVPLMLRDPGAAAPSVGGAIAIYRYPQQLNRTIVHGTFLLWLVTGASGLVLFAALYGLFRSAYRRQIQAESEFAKLSTEHERIVQLEKLSAIGQMVSEVAHQLNNPLVGVINLAQLAERELGNNNERARELLGEVRKAGDHCREFVQRMLKFNELARSELRTIELGALVRETIVFLSQSVAGHPKVNLEGDTQPLMVQVDAVLVRHALFNIIHNAAQAAPECPVEVSLALETRKGIPGCKVSVSDCGPGIRPEIAGRLFTPFFTTRPQGTGLGLTVAQHIAVHHGGTIRGENKPGGGALFTLWLPGAANA